MFQFNWFNWVYFSGNKTKNIHHEKWTVFIYKYNLIFLSPDAAYIVTCIHEMHTILITCIDQNNIDATLKCGNSWY